MSVTQGRRFLKQKKIEVEARDYDCRVKGAEYAASELDWPLESMFKTLIVALDNKKFVIAIMPGDIELSLKKLSRAAGAKAARMSTPEEAQKQTGYLVGGISPFGTKKQMTVWAHETLGDFEKVGINGGRRGTIIFLDPKKIITLLGVKLADLSV